MLKSSIFGLGECERKSNFRHCINGEEVQLPIRSFNFALAFTGISQNILNICQGALTLSIAGISLFMYIVPTIVLRLSKTGSVYLPLKRF